MYRITFAIIGIVLSTAIMAQQTVRMEITQLPSYHPAGSDIYIAGSFNGWNPHDEKYRFSKDDQGHYFFDLSLLAGNYEYKITRGGWDQAECKKGGTSSQNRTLTIPGDNRITLAVEEWADRYPAKPRVSTASSNVQIFDTAFLIPQLNRTRRIWIYLPPDYNSNPGKRYPVLYMQDGQNLFDEATAYAGEWGVDEYMDSVKAGQCIVVGIDHGGDKRMTEYNPYDNNRFGRGEGKKYVDFLVNTLKPVIDKKFRTLPDMANTGIAGSSMGGLISMYAVLKYPEIFGKAGVFSPSFWITDSKIFSDMKKAKKIGSYIYLYGGRKEGAQMVDDLAKVPPNMKNVRITTVLREEGQHNESRWRLEFPLFYNAITGKGEWHLPTLPSYWLEH